VSGARRCVASSACPPSCSRLFRLLSPLLLVRHGLLLRHGACSDGGGVAALSVLRRRGSRDSRIRRRAGRLRPRDGKIRYGWPRLTDAVVPSSPSFQPVHGASVEAAVPRRSDARRLPSPRRPPRLRSARCLTPRFVGWLSPACHVATSEVRQWFVPPLPRAFRVVCCRAARRLTFCAYASA